MTRFLKEFMNKLKRGNRKPPVPNKNHPYRTGVDTLKLTAKHEPKRTLRSLGLPKRVHPRNPIKQGFELEPVGRGRKRKLLGMELALSCLFLAIISGCSTPSFAFTDDQAIKAIIGEAEDQGYEGMLAVACAIRNRGSLKGVYGLNAPRVRNNRFSKGVWLQAQKAWGHSKDLLEWELSWVNEEGHKGKRHWRKEGYDASGGANHWENIRTFGKPKWADACVQTVIVKNHVFYRC